VCERECAPPYPFRFTGKELDRETGLYYYGARYLNPQTSIWLSADPAMGEYIPRAPIDDEAKKYNQNLPGMGGVFNYINLHAYHYAGNNPVKLTDPNGELDSFPRNHSETVRWLQIRGGSAPVNKYAMQEAYGTDYGPCIFRSLLAIAETRVGKNLNWAQLAYARKMFYGKLDNTNWAVTLDNAAEGYGYLEDVVNIGLKLLGSDEKAAFIDRVYSLDNIPDGTQATLIRRDIPGDKYGNKHGGEGDARGRLVYDPLGEDTFSGKPIVQVDAFKFTPKKQEDL
jgi:RHS repeat-associated protein